MEVIKVEIPEGYSLVGVKTEGNEVFITYELEQVNGIGFLSDIYMREEPEDDEDFMEFDDDTGIVVMGAAIDPRGYEALTPKKNKKKDKK